MSDPIEMLIFKSQVGFEVKNLILKKKKKMHRKTKVNLREGKLRG